MQRSKKNGDGKGREEKKKRENFRSRLGFKEHDVIMTKEQSVIAIIMKSFPNEKTSLQHNILGCFINLYCPKHKLAIEINEEGHTDRPKSKEKEREYFDIFIEIDKIYNHISESNKKITKESNKRSLIDNNSKKLLELEFKSNHSIKSRCLKKLLDICCHHYKTCKRIV